MSRPVIGITSYVELARWGDWEATTTLVPHSYVHAVTEAGGCAVVVPPGEHTAGTAEVLDGLVLAGGADVDPASYGAEPHPRTNPCPIRDTGEFPLLAAALDRDLPVLGVCRGMQVLVSAYGGTLHQHLPDVLGHDKHRPAPAVFGWHGVRLTPGSRVATVLGEELEVNSYHHQGIADPGGLTVTGWADDGLPEVVEDPERPFVVGVQWHPEEARDHRLFESLVAAAMRPETVPVG